VIVGGVLVITVVLGVLLAILLDQPFWGQGIVRILVIAPFFVMPTVSALVWKNMFMDPVNGMFAASVALLRRQPVSWMSDASRAVDHPDRVLAMAALRDADPADRDPVARQRAARGGRDGRRPGPVALLYIVLPHLARAITIVILIQTIFLLSIFAEIFVTTGGSFGTRTLTYLIFQRVVDSQNIGLGSAGGVYADHPRQHRRAVPDAHRRQEPGPLRGQTWHAQSPPNARSSPPPSPGRSAC
jgi:sorbitol/mannitol transport system permease protein